MSTNVLRRTQILLLKLSQCWLRWIGLLIGAQSMPIAIHWCFLWVFQKILKCLCEGDENVISWMTKFVNIKYKHLYSSRFWHKSSLLSMYPCPSAWAKTILSNSSHWPNFFASMILNSTYYKINKVLWKLMYELT